MCELQVINYIKQLNEFYSILDYKPLSSNAISLYGFLLHVANKTGWLKEFRVANTTIMSKCKLNTSALQRARMELINNGYIRYKKGSNQNEMPRYSLVILYFEQANAQANKQADEQAHNQAEDIPNTTPNTQAGEYINKQNNTLQNKNNKLNQTKLNLFFNYISNEEAEFDGISQSQKEGIIRILKDLEIYINPLANLSCLPSNYIEDAKVQYWVIKEIYFSEYKVYLNDLKRNDFMFRYLKTQKYMEAKENYDEEEFVSYFITCLHDEMKGEKNVVKTGNRKMV
ncbi:MAG: hypothetical protein HFJ60_08030 [Clostridia bacterium]|nr:hypothetical protein [Clostridia bacterium]